MQHVGLGWIGAFKASAWTQHRVAVGRQITAIPHRIMTKPIKGPKNALISRTKPPGSEGKLAPVKGSKLGVVTPGGKIDLLTGLPAEQVWLQSLKNERTRRAYRNDVQDFVAVLDILNRAELYKVSTSAVNEWVSTLVAREVKNSTIRRKLSSLSSLFRHLISVAPNHVSEEERKQLPTYNPVRDVTRPSINRTEGSTNVLSQEESRKVLDAPPLVREVKRNGRLVEVPLEGAALVRSLRDRLILSIGFQTGARRAEIAFLQVGGIHWHDGFLCIRFIRKGEKEHRIPLHSETQARLMDYLDAAGHRDDRDSPLIRPTRRNQLKGTDDMNRHMEPHRIYQIFKRWARDALGEGREIDFSPHSMRGTFITRAYENGCPRERIQKDVGHAHASTTDLYIKSTDSLERAATFFANY